ncbi:hypothetical protein [Methylobacterium gnaphalii]|uniref:Uncharacterized protein n=1 Tax=Methylobacterium gnaphalii TaxID=1010610 RepID=A0A512JMA3_9HYPH|nr:hypothetical protein [Methylobacterium gnaphalii]GEP11099.1 hypothetical protein MGN01_29440 [Methylobacterium gnaphalii]GJD67088.1 hypothetical protein MMMDOFMJ_0001 [Methylobacterium gnaphalii]GLS50377.1 hypothetical protein GCM10007885_32290 [Methylobacterium gnaphalii]
MSDPPRQVTLGDLIDALDHLDPDRMIAFEFGGCKPKEFESYRGEFGGLALGFSDRTGAVLISDLVSRVMDALETTFISWEGATHTVSRDTLLWAANSGCISETAIVDVRERGAIAYIVTAWRD